MKQNRLAILLGVVLLASTLIPTATSAATCTTVASCTAEQAKLKKQQLEAKQKFEQNRRQAQSLQGVINELKEDIDYTESKINNTENQIRITEEILNSLAGNITTSETQLSAAYVSLYELSRSSTGSQLLLQESLNDALSEAQYIQSIQSQLQKDLTGLRANKAERERQKADLQSQKSSLEGDKTELAAKKSQQSYLLSTAQSNASYYQGLSADIQKKITEIERQLSVLISRQSWGTDIVSVNQSNWYYSQLNYPNTFLGRSPYTVAQYGCLITSIAMVATFYGQTVTPPQIAQGSGNFDSQGYLIKQPPNPVSFSSMSTSPINWGTVNNELNAGRPVIVSIYIPSVGKINSDGSSHFVVLHGFSGGKYLMHDPLGANRGYSISHVKSMKIIRK